MINFGATIPMIFTTGNEAVSDPNTLFPGYGDYFSGFAQVGTEPTILAAYGDFGSGWRFTGMYFNEASGTVIIDVAVDAIPPISNFGGMFGAYVGTRWIAIGSPYDNGEVNFEWCGWDSISGNLVTHSVPNFEPGGGLSSSGGPMPDHVDVSGKVMKGFMGVAPQPFYFYTINTTFGTVEQMFESVSDFYPNAWIEQFSGGQVFLQDYSLNFVKIEYTHTPIGDPFIQTEYPMIWDNPDIAAAITDGGNLPFVFGDYYYYPVLYAAGNPITPYLVRTLLDLSTYDILELSFDSVAQTIIDGHLANEYSVYFYGSETDGKIYMMGGPTAGGLFYATMSEAGAPAAKSNYSLEYGIRLGCWSPCINVGYKEE